MQTILWLWMDPSSWKMGQKEGGEDIGWMMWPWNTSSDQIFPFLVLLSCTLACLRLHVPSPPGISSTIISSTVVPTQLQRFVVLYQPFHNAHPHSHFPMLSLGEKSCSLNDRAYDGWLKLFSITMWFTVPGDKDRQRQIHSWRILVSQGPAPLYFRGVLDVFGSFTLKWSNPSPKLKICKDPL